MSSDSGTATPRHYFLNERHLLAPVENEGRGRQTKVLNVDFKTLGNSLASRIESIKSARRASPDPSVKDRTFILAQPQSVLERSSTAKTATEGKIAKPVSLSGKDSRIIEKMGFNLVGTTQEGAAIVHASNERLGQIQQSLKQLEILGVREQNKWAHIQDFVEVPLTHKTSLAWWGDNQLQPLLQVTIDLAPFLSRKEIDSLIKTFAKLLKDGERHVSTGHEFSGRVWIDAELKPDSVLWLAETFQSIGSIHPPVRAIPVAATISPSAASSERVAIIQAGQDPKSLPCVAVFDTGIPPDHAVLAAFRRGGIIGEGCSGTVPDGHGSFVASRVVFGDIEMGDEDTPTRLVARCSVYDVNLSDRGPNGSTAIRSCSLLSSIQRLRDAAPDVRVLNFSFDAPNDLATYEGGYREKLLREMADVDNRAFADDLLIVVAAGNTPPGLKPNPEYPNHLEQDEWKLRAWSRCFNVLTCGGSADRLSPNGVTKEPGAPSPFTRVGPGFSNSRKPDFSAHAGNADGTYQHSSGDGLGVWGCDDLGNWVDWVGTSHAAPLLAGEAARTLAFLQSRCAPGGKPFAALAKAVMALRAHKRPLSESLSKLASRTLGFGVVTLEDVEPAVDERAVFLWQGVIGSDDEKLILELPLPGQWVREAQKPTLRLIAAWETPVNPAIEELWACRQVSVTLRPSIDGVALRSASRNSPGYPMMERLYDLGDEGTRDIMVARDTVLAEMSYSIVAPYPAGFESFSPQQRVALAFELFDSGAERVSPHGHIQAMPISATLDRLSSVVSAPVSAVMVRVPQ